MALVSGLRNSLDQSGIGYDATGQLVAQLTAIDTGMAGTTLVGAATTTDVLTGEVTGDTQKRFILNGGGTVEWGSGSGAVDTNLYRSAADTLKTDDAFISAVGVQTLATAVTVTSDGLTTGLIPANAGHVTITSDSADKIATLPTAVAGMHIVVVTGATGCEVRTPAGTNATINTTDSDGTNELALAASQVTHFRATSATAWTAYAWTTAGAAVATLVPDAA